MAQQTVLPVFKSADDTEEREVRMPKASPLNMPGARRVGTEGTVRSGGPVIHRDPPFPSHATAQFELVTPELAARYLERMHANRSLSRLEANVMEENLREGTFYPAISPVYFGADDDPYDGQHRFEAIVNTGISAWMLIVRGITEEEAESIDTGRKRTVSDAVKMKGIGDYKRRSTVARWLALYLKYGIDAIRTPSSVNFPLTQGDVMELIDTPGLYEAIRLAQSVCTPTGMNPNYVAYAVMRTGAGFDHSGFWARVRSGEELKKGDPALTLREYFRTRSTSRSNVKSDRRLLEMNAITTAWNKNVTGQSWKSVQPTFTARPDGTRYFPAANLPDFIGAMWPRPDIPSVRKAVPRG